jgi:hypothetical protein
MFTCKQYAFPPLSVVICMRPSLTTENENIILQACHNLHVQFCSKFVIAVT